MLARGCRQLDAGLREGGRDLAEKWPQVFLKAPCSAGSACTCRGWGLRRLPPNRARYTQPRYTLTGRPRRARIHAATSRLVHRSPSGAGPRTTAASSACSSAESSGAARWECVYCRLRIASGPPMLSRRASCEGPTARIARIARIARALGDVRCGVSRGQEPQDLPSRPLVRFFGRPVAPLELVYRQMRFQPEASSQVYMMQQPCHKWYDSLLSSCR